MSDNNAQVLFSIIVPTYNRAGLISTAIDSILQQNYNNFEILVVDDGSTDNTGEVIRQKYSHLPQVRYLKQKNAERGAARNLGAKHANGDYLNFFDSDDLMYPHHLSTAYQAIIQNNYPPIFHLNYHMRVNDNTVTILSDKTDRYANKSLIKGSYLQPNTVIIKRDIAKDNPFNEDRGLAALEDWELWLRIACKYPILFVNQITTCLIHHNYRSTVGGNNDALIQRVNKFLNCVLQNKEVVAYYNADINKFIASCYTYIALHIAVNHNSPGVALKYLYKGTVKYPASVFTRRFLAVIKHITIKR